MARYTTGSKDDAIILVLAAASTRRYRDVTFEIVEHTKGRFVLEYFNSGRYQTYANLDYIRNCSHTPEGVAETARSDWNTGVRHIRMDSTPNE